MLRKTTQYFISSILIALLAAGCDDNVASSIPDYPVSLQLNLATTYPTFRNNINQSLVFDKLPAIPKYTDRIGYGGILVYVGFDGVYYAFDMSCPYEISRTIRVYPDGNGKAVCEKCGSTFDLSYGIANPEIGPAKEFLKKYRTAVSGDILYVIR